mgnify:CR=1 FL=1
MTPAGRWPNSVRLYLASFLVVGMSLSVLGPALTELRDKSGADIGGIGVLFMGQSLGYVCGSILGGRLYDRFDGEIPGLGVRRGSLEDVYLALLDDDRNAHREGGP